MSILTKFIFTSFFIFGLFVFVVLHSLNYSKNVTLKQISVVKLSGFSDFRYSVSYLEPQNRLYSDYSNSLYPQMKPINYMDFVYAK